MSAAVLAGLLLGAAVLTLPSRTGASAAVLPRAAGAGRGTRAAPPAGDVAPSEVAGALALLALAYRSGLATWDVLDAVADGLSTRPAADLHQVSAALRWGASDTEAWGSVGREWSPAARAVAVAHLAGVPPGPLLVAASRDLHEAEAERVEQAAARVGVRLVAPLGLVLLPAFCLTTVVPLVVALAADLVSR